MRILVDWRNRLWKLGLSDAERDAEIISEQIKIRLDPIPEFHLSFFRTEDDKTLILLNIRQGEETPYYYSADGVMEAKIIITPCGY